MKRKDSAIDWWDEFNGAITVCDRDGVIVYMNQYSIRQFAKYGGEKLLGSNLLDCHPEPSRSKLIEMLKQPAENMYTTENNGVKKMIVQTPWMQGEQFCGIVELSFTLDQDLSNHLRT